MLMILLPVTIIHPSIQVTIINQRHFFIHPKFFHPSNLFFIHPTFFHTPKARPVDSTCLSLWLVRLLHVYNENVDKRKFRSRETFFLHNTELQTGCKSVKYEVFSPENTSNFVKCPSPIKQMISLYLFINNEYNETVVEMYYMNRSLRVIY